ncbi:Uncharacterised protein [Klebsiella pneumoniae]|nr:Uncharacterised protein [Klebsiella pneumoniae]
MKGLSWWPSKRVISTAPSTAPIIPGSSRRRKSDLLTLPSLTWEIPEKPVVNTSAMCTLALAAAGVAPALSRKVVAVMP